MYEEVADVIVYDTRIRGAIFCRVIRMIQCIQDTPCMMGGNQKCTGAAPIFRNRAPRIRRLGLVEKTHVDVALVRIITEPRAWIRKYLRAASDEYELNLDEMMGMNDSRFNSRPSQLVNQEFDDVAIIIPRVSDSPNIIRLGFELRIKKRSCLHRWGMSPLACLLAYLFPVFLGV